MVQGGGTSTLAATKSILIGAGGFTAGLIQFMNFTSSTTTATTITGSNTANLTLGPSASFAGDVTANCGGIVLNGTTFSGLATFTKTGASNDAGSGNNIFNGATSLTNTGTGYLLSSNSNHDVFNSTLNLTSSGTGLIYMAQKFDKYPL